MNGLTVIEREGQRVLMTIHLAENLGSDVKIINRNFQRNASRYKVGKHYFALTGEELREFKGSRQFDASLKYTSVLHLWTEKGAWLHAKSLNTDEAWDAYEALVDDYYRVKQESLATNQLSTELQMFKQLWDGMAKKELEDARRDEELKGLKTTVTVIQDTFLHNEDDWRGSINRMLNDAVKRTDGDYQQVRRMSYSKLEARARCDLGIRLDNLKKRLKQSGATATRINKASKLEVIESNDRLREIYTTIVKELSIGSLV
ncbi:ORF6N domain-containing protein [Shouchella hunanensis]|uniref:ORF6N domain-containing protein n=1 Tax=Shouchella hunanensis TaxID=766894 RepID=A0ABY7W5N3_9BACI|nr:ORF6N domain-containing protein [Shouchella hunanensis]WDF02924.1 ORF6N domain-containing protein [Shouchella hunanensis]